MLNIVNIDSYKYSDEAKSKLISIGNYQEVNIQKKDAVKLIKFADAIILRFRIKIKIKNKKYIKIKALKKILQISDFIIVCLSLEKDTINFLKYSDFKK
jgi:hypothetical protein